jgi:putative CocE/NonD family hydrolase
MIWLAMLAMNAAAAPVHQFGYILMADGNRLAYTLYRTAQDGRFPTLLIYNMYDASAVTPSWNQTETSEITDYLERGYAVMGLNVRGTGCSTGEEDVLHAARVGQDGAEAVEWIARQSWSDGNIGMFGHSGSGITQFYVAAQGPPHLKAIIPGAAPADLYRDIAYPGGLFNYAFLYHWTEDAQPASSRRAAQAHIAAGDSDCAARVGKRKATALYSQMLSHTRADEWWAERSIDSIAGRIRTPAYILFGWQDQNVASRAVYVVDKLSGPKRMLLAEEGHSFYIRSLEVRREKLRFFDHWLKGARNGVMEDKPIQVWLSMKGNVERIPDRVVRLDRLPASGTRWRKLYLSADRRLLPAPSNEPASLTYLYPLGSAFVYGGSAYPHTPFRIGSLVFRSEPLSQPLTVLGPISARLFVSSSEKDTSFQLVLNEISVMGERKYLQRGYQLASLRELDPTRTSEAIPYYRFQDRRPLIPGEVTEVRVELNATGSIVRAGSMLELIIMAPNMAPEPLGQWGFLPLPMSHNRIHFSAAHPSQIVLAELP